MIMSKLKVPIFECDFGNLRKILTDPLIRTLSLQNGATERQIEVAVPVWVLRVSLGQWAELPEPSRKVATGTGLTGGRSAPGLGTCPKRAYHMGLSINWGVLIGVLLVKTLPFGANHFRSIFGAPRFWELP